jgi:hypothetical protein
MMGVNGITENCGFIPYLPLSNNNFTFPLCAHVIKTTLPCDCLIGITFMRFYGVIIDFDKNTLTIGGKQISFRLDRK